MSGDSEPQPAPAHPPIVNRRWVLTLAAGLGGALAVPALASQRADGARKPLRDKTASLAMQDTHGGHEGASPYAATPVPWEPEDLVDPEDRRSVDGVLATSIRADYMYKDIGGYRLHLRGYDGMMPGPTLRVQPGDRLGIEMINDLPPNRDQVPANTDHPHNFNTLNFHAHGTHVSPGGISDNVLRTMEPGGTYPVEIDFPDDHTRGTYWYHPHHHGGADIQVASGMVGALIVEGDFADVPEIAEARERVIVIGQVLFDGLRTVESFETTWPETATRFYTVNGQREPIVRLRSGEVQRWRFVNAGYQDDILLNVEGHDLHTIALDGISLDRIDSASQVLMAPGQRADLLIQAGEPGTYQLAALPYDQGYPGTNGPLATVIVEGEPLPMSIPDSLPAAPLAAIADDELTGSRELVFSGNAPESDAAGYYNEFDFMVDGNTFDPDRIDHRIALGSVEEWTVRNIHVHDHVFHIHVNPFMVTHINDEPVADPVWRDTAIVPRGGSIVFRTRFTDFTGMYVLHCHMMNHEALGMMQLIEVFAPE